MPVRNRVRELRLERELSQVALAELTGIWSHQISKIENHRSDFIDIRKLEKLMIVFEITSFDDILVMED